MDYALGSVETMVDTDVSKTFALGSTIFLGRQG